jgi:hypothetical protein
MFRTIASLSLGLTALATLNAGQIQIGGSNGTSGLSSNYLAGVAGSPCAGAYASGQSSLAGYAGCQAAGTGGVANTTGLNGTSFKLFSYSGSLFNSLTENGSPLATPPTTLTANDALATPVTFDLLSTNQQWGGSGGTADGTFGGTATSTSLTIPISIFGVDKVWTMLQDYWGTNGSQNTTVVFNFGATSNQTSGYTSLTFKLVNGNQIRDAVDCSGLSTSPAPGANPNDFNAAGCQSFAETTSSATTASAFTEVYNGDTAASSMYYNTSGSVHLDDQLFQFGAAQSTQWLDNIVITNTDGLAGTPTQTSRTSLSAITVDTTAVVPTPEPGSIMLILSGISAIGVSRIRRRK